MRRVKSVFLTGFVLLAISLAGCKQDPGVPPIVPPGSDTSKSTGLPSISVSGVALEGSGAESINIAPTSLSGGAGSFSVTDGKLTLNLGTPSSGFYAVSSLNGQSEAFGGRTDSGYELTISDPSAQMYVIDNFQATVGSKTYTIRRWTSETDNATYGKESGIIYVYVDKDCTVTRAAKSWKDTSGTNPLDVNFGVMNLPLEKGWNLLQVDTENKIEGSMYNSTMTYKIADTNIPWSISS